MASISTDTSGNRRILFMVGRNNRKVIRLGKVPMRTADEIKRRIELLTTAAETGVSVDRETAEWVSKRADLYDKLAAAGLVVARPRQEQATLAAWVNSYMAMRGDVKAGTTNVYDQTRVHLIEYFGANKPLADITALDADSWRIWLAQTKGLADSTAKRHCGRAKQFFRAAVRKRLIAESPFADMKGIGVQSNWERSYFISRTDAQKIIDACPDAQWRLLFALSRFGGLRCPSEHLRLRWCDIDLAAGRMTVHSPKTEHHHGKASRVVPIFPELRPYLEDAEQLAEAGTEWVITRYRTITAAMGYQFRQIIQRAGLTPWPKLFQNLRSTRQTELAEQFPAHVVCAWIGNSEAVAREHYLQVTDEHFAKAAQIQAQQGSVSVGMGEQRNRENVKIREEYSPLLTCTHEPAVCLRFANKSEAQGF